MIDGAQISETDFAGLAAHDSSVMQQALQGAFGALSHFEVLTSLAFKHFQRKQVLESTASRLCQQHYVCVCVFSTTLHFYHCKSAKSMLSLTSCLALCKANACTLQYSPLKLYCWRPKSQSHRIQLQGTGTWPLHAEQMATFIAASVFITGQLSTLPAMLLALQVQVQLAVVETGLGGVADATNVFEPAQLACAVITAIDNDHMRALGESPQELRKHEHELCHVPCQMLHTHTADNTSSTLSGALALLLGSAIQPCSCGTLHTLFFIVLVTGCSCAFSRQVNNTYTYCARPLPL